MDACGCFLVGWFWVVLGWIVCFFEVLFWGGLVGVALLFAICVLVDFVALMVYCVLRCGEFCLVLGLVCGCIYFFLFDFVLLLGGFVGWVWWVF